jgi:hypothetical protein
MRRWLAVALMCVVVLSALGQTLASKYQPGTITAVVAHQSPDQQESNIPQYDVSVRVGNTSYVVLYAPPNGANGVKLAAGIEVLVLVGSKTLTFNSRVSGTTEVPILSRETLAPQSLDSSKICGQYFTLKLQRLTEILVLTDAQQAEIRPILEQEAGEVNEICFNPALSQNDTLKQYEKILQASDEKIKPKLFGDQLQKLQDLRKGQKQDIKRIIAEQKSSKQN